GHVEGRGLAGAVRAQQSDDLTRRDVEVDPANDRTAAVGLRQVVCPKDGHARALRGYHKGHEGHQGLALYGPSIVSIVSIVVTRRDYGHFPPPFVCVRMRSLPSTSIVSVAFRKVNVLPMVSRP